MKFIRSFSIILIIYFISTYAFGMEDLQLPDKISIDTIWLLLSAFLVFFMQAGFAMVEGGFTRAKNTGNIQLSRPQQLP